MATALPEPQDPTEVGRKRTFPVAAPAMSGTLQNTMGLTGKTLGFSSRLANGKDLPRGLLCGAWTTVDSGSCGGAHAPVQRALGASQGSQAGVVKANTPPHARKICQPRVSSWLGCERSGCVDKEV